MSSTMVWDYMPEPQKYLFSLKMAEIRVRANVAAKEYLEENVKMLGGKMTTWTDGYERLMRAAEKKAGERPQTRTIPLHVFVSRDGGTCSDGEHKCVLRIFGLALGGLAWPMRHNSWQPSNQHALQSYLKKDDDVLNYENLRTVRGWVGF
ncbi:hypothetical protein RI054_08g45050 [Pseudoscourfieldia marina]